MAFYHELNNLWLFISFLAFLSHWRLRKTNSWLRNKKKTLFRPFYQISGFSIIFSVFELLAASENEQVASKHGKKVVLAILPKFCFLSFLGIFESLAASEIE